MDFGISGKVAMVAAASKGIGLATAKLLAAEGCHVSICARNEEVLEAAAAEIGPETRSYVVDVNNPEDLAWWLEQTTADLSAPEILVTNTGGPPAGNFTTLTDEHWQSGFDSTLMNVIRLVRMVAPSMLANGFGRIVHITSLVAKEPSPMLPISSTLRSGLMALTRLQATEFAPHGITVNSVLPGHTLTDRQRHLAEIRGGKDGISAEEALEKQGKEVPVGRLASPEEIAAAIVFLCSIPAAYITGSNLLVDGGLTKGLA
ncbi:MAG: SDR family oxidoreductase [Chlorobia bacterium]|nr:SDR family oxidoreductase [Fimbriimonadaceae bacterium]